MISIQAHLDRPDAAIYLASLAERHFEFLTKLRKDGAQRENSLITKTLRYLSATETQEYLEVYALNDVALLDRQRNFFHLLLDFDSFYLREIIVGKPEDLVEVRKELMSVLWETDLYTVIDGNLVQTPFGVLLSEKIFAYRAFRSSPACLLLIKSIGFGATTCPYCNYNKLDLVPKIGTAGVAKKNIAYLDLDHFFAKVQNPFFAVSFFNLIPSCHSCNSVDKGSKEFTLDTQIHPYFISFDEYFRFRISLAALLGDPVDEIYIDPIQHRPLDQTVSDFNLLGKYNNNLADATSLINRFIKHKWRIGTPEEEMFVDLLLGDIPKKKENILRHPTAKFKRDLLAQLDVGGVLKLS